MKFDLNQEYTFAKEIVDNKGIAVCKDYITITTSNEKNSKGQIFARVKQCFDGKEDTYSNCHVPLAKPNKMIVNGTAVTLEEQNGNSIITACEEPYKKQLAGLIKQENTFNPSKASDIGNGISKLVKNMLANIKETYKSFLSFLTNIFSPIINWFNDLFNSIKEDIGKKAVKEFLATSKSNVQDFCKTAYIQTTDSFNSSLNFAKETVHKGLSTISNAMTAGLETITGKAKEKLEQCSTDMGKASIALSNTMQKLSAENKSELQKYLTSWKEQGNNSNSLIDLDGFIRIINETNPQNLNGYEKDLKAKYKEYALNNELDSSIQVTDTIDNSLVHSIQSGIYSTLNALNPMKFVPNLTTFIAKTANESVNAATIKGDTKAASTTTSSANNDTPVNDNTASAQSVTI